MEEINLMKKFAHPNIVGLLGKLYMHTLTVLHLIMYTVCTTKSIKRREKESTLLHFYSLYEIILTSGPQH